MLDLRKGISEHIKPEFQEIMMTDLSLSKYCNEEFCKYAINNTCLDDYDSTDGCYDAIATYLECKEYLKEKKENE